MAHPYSIDGLTVQYFVGDLAAAVKFYSTVFQRPPDLAPHDDFCEWELFPGAWFQIALGPISGGSQMRFRVTDIDAERERLGQELGLIVSPIERVSGLVALCNFRDPWGNPLGLYARLFTDAPSIPGGSYRDFEPAAAPPAPLPH